jgi:hypothetical protein
MWVSAGEIRTKVTLIQACIQIFGESCMGDYWAER